MKQLSLLIGLPAVMSMGLMQQCGESPSEITSADYILPGAKDDYAGYALTHGDVNGDGLQDLIVTAPYASWAENAMGKVFVVFGRPGGLPEGFTLADADACFVGEKAEDYLGFHVASGGDINGDGFDDIVVGNPWADSEYEADVGRVYVILGRATGWPKEIYIQRFADAMYYGALSMGGTGGSVAIDGDINGDGLDDLVVGAPNIGLAIDGGALWNVGLTYIVFGRTDGWRREDSIELMNDVVLYGEDFDPATVLARKAALQYSMRSDFDGDGVQDLVIGDADADIQDFTGKVYLVAGRKEGWSALDYTPVAQASFASFIGEQAEDRAGYALTTPGDLNGDGRDDLVVSAPWSDEVDQTSGKVYVILGGDSWRNNVRLWDVDASFSGPGYIEKFGESLSGGGDYNGDGLADFAVGAPDSDDNGREGGKAYLFLGQTESWGWSENPESAAAAFYLGEGEQEDAGRSVLMDFDANGDGLEDFLIGAPHTWTLPEVNGRVYFFYGE